jgi:hypothetical protein
MFDLDLCLSSSVNVRYIFLDIFCTGMNKVVKITHFSSEIVLQTTKHMMIYPGSDSSLKVIALRSAV